MMLCSHSESVDVKHGHMDKYLDSAVVSEFSHAPFGHQVPILHQSTTSSIDRLPRELLEVIIWLSVEDESTPQRRCYTLSHVNGFWRQTIFGNPSFWTLIDLSWPAEVLNTTLERSGSVPKLSFRFTEHAPSLSSASDEAIQHILASQSSRVETLQVNIGSLVARKCAGITFPVLKNATFTYRPSNEELNYRIPFINNATSLRTLDISNCHVDLPWDQLSSALCSIRQLKIRFNSRQGYTSFLMNTQSFLNLRDLSVESLYGVDDDPDFEPRDSNARLLRNPTHAFTLTNLETLHIHSFNMPTLMTRLYTPSLQTYEVHTRKYGSSHVLRRHLHPIFEDFDYSAIKSLYVGFHACCSAICILGSAQESLSDLLSSRPSHSFESSFGINARGKTFHIQLFHSLTADAFVPKSLALLLPKLSNLLHLSLRLHDSFEINDVTSSFPVLDMLKTNENRCPNLETILYCFGDGQPLCRVMSANILDILKSRIDYGNSSLKRVWLENYPADEDLVKGAEEFGVSITFNSAPSIPI